MSIVKPSVFVNEKVGFMGNRRKYYLSAVLEQGMLAFASGAVLQTVLLEMGLTSETTNQFTAIQTGVQVGAILIFSLWADRIRNLIKWYGLNALLFLPLLAFLLIACYNPGGWSVFLFLLFATASVYNIGYGISSILSLKVPYQIMDMHDYSKVAALTGVVVGISAMALSAVLTWLQSYFDFILLMRWAFVFAIVTTVIRAILLLSMKQTHYTQITKGPVRKFRFFKYKPFSFFIIPNLLRGLSCGLVGMAVSIGYYTGHLNSQSATLVAVITGLVTILGCAIYAVIAGKVTERSIVLIASIGVFVFMPMITQFSSTAAYLVFYGIAWFMVVFVNYAVPVAVTKIADYDTMGRYSAGRMLINNAGNMLAGFLCVPMFRLVGVQFTMYLFAGMQLISGICYYIYMKKHNIR